MPRPNPKQHRCASCIAVLARRLWLSSQRRQPADTLALLNRVEGAQRALRISAELIEDLQAEMKVKTVALEQLVAQHAEYEHLGVLHQPEVQAIMRAVADAVSQTHRQQTREARVHLWIVLVTAVPLGVLAILLAGVLFHQ